MEEQHQVSKHELSLKLSSSGVEQLLFVPVVKNKDVLMLGNVDYHKLPSGISVHTSDFIEQQNAKCSSPLSPSVMVGVLFEGVIEFSLDQMTYSISAENGPRVFAYVTNRSVLFMRRLIENNKIKKVNISVDLNWLLNRMKTSPTQFIKTLLKDDVVVKDWVCDEETRQLGEHVFLSHVDEDIFANLYSEQYALKLLTLCIHSFLIAPKTEMESPSLNLPAPARDFEQEVKSYILERKNGEEIAKALGTSISTLQRYFRQYHDVSFADYVRTQKLEYARNALIFKRITIGEAAYLVGYNHTSNFVSAFKKHFNQTPTETLKQHTS